MKKYNCGIVGLGPAGLGVATILYRYGQLNNVICFEKGQLNSNQCTLLTDISCCENDNCGIISGLGGASSFSSGKISNYPAGSGLLNFFKSEQELKALLNQIICYLINEIDITKIPIDESCINFAEQYYSKKGIDYKYYDVFEFDGEKYRQFITKYIELFVQNGLEVYDNTNVLKIQENKNESYFNVVVKTPKGIKTIAIEKVVIASGALETQNSLASEYIQYDNSEYEIGLRIELKTENAGALLSSHGDLKLKKNSGRTYCVTENGVVIAYKTNAHFFLEGCKSTKQSNYTNMAVLIKFKGNKLLKEFYNNYSVLCNGRPVKQTLTNYLKGVGEEESNLFTTCSIAHAGNINMLFPPEINFALKCFIQDVLIDSLGLKCNDLVLIAPELKILNNINISSDFSIFPNLYIVGAATGRFRGILQSICSGIKCGEYILRR